MKSESFRPPFACNSLNRASFFLTVALSLGGTAHSAIYNWEGDTNPNLSDATNWMENAWTQWNDYHFGAASTSGVVNIDGVFGVNHLALVSGLGQDIIIGSDTNEKLFMGVNVVGNPSALISIDADSMNLSIDTECQVAGAVTWDVGTGRTLTLNGALNNWFQAAALVKEGAGTAILSGSNGYSGGTTVNGGVISLIGANSLPASGPVSLSAEAKLSNDTPAGTSFNLGPLTLMGGELAATAAPDAGLGNYHLNGDVTVSGNSTSTISADLRVIANENRTFNVAATGDDSGVDLLVSGKLGHYNDNSWGYATKTGAGTMKISGSNDLGDITVNGGLLILENTGISGMFANGVTNNAQMELSVTLGNSISWGNNSLKGTGNYSKTGDGTLTLTGSLSYYGTMAVVGGTLELQGGGDGGSDYNGGDIRINGASTLRVNGQRYNFAGETFTFDSTGGGALDAIASGAGGFVFTGDNTFATRGGIQSILSGTKNGPENQGLNLNGHTAIFDVETGSDTTSDLNVTGTIWNGGSVTKTGAGRLEISVPQQYSGTTTVSEGTLILGDGNNNINLSDSGDLIIASGSTLKLDYDGEDSDLIDELWLGGVQQNAGTYGAGSYSGATITGTGTLTVQNGPITNPYANWMATNYPSVVSPDNLPEADPDHDGIANLMEYVLKDGDPSTFSNTILPILNASGETFVFTYFRRADATGTTQIFEYGSDLSNWTSVSIPSGSSVVTDLGGGIEQVEITVSKGNHIKLFGRLRVSQL
jgi:autotransporter-associated beta strand protein